MPEEKKEGTRVVFIIEKSCVDSTIEHVHVLGNIERWGKWHVHKAKEVGYTGLNGWFLEEYLPPNTVVEFQLMLMRMPKRSLTYDMDCMRDMHPVLVHKETDFVRRLHVTDVPMKVHLTYNQKEVKVWKLRSSLARDGSPVTTHQYPLKDVLRGLYTPKPGGWDFFDADGKENPDTFARLETSTLNDHPVACIRESLAEERFKEHCRKIQREADARAKETAAKQSLPTQNKQTTTKSVSCQVDDDLPGNDKTGFVGLEQTTQYGGTLGEVSQMTLSNMAHTVRFEEVGRTMGKNHYIDTSLNEELKSLSQENIASTSGDIQAHAVRKIGILKLALPLGVAIGGAATALYLWHKWH